MIVLLPATYCRPISECLCFSICFLTFIKMAPKRVAIIGGGCSGIAALWALRYSEHEVHLYEAEPKLPNFIDTFPFLVGDRIVRVNTQLVTFKASTSRQFPTRRDSCAYRLTLASEPLHFPARSPCSIHEG